MTLRTWLVLVLVCALTAGACSASVDVELESVSTSSTDEPDGPEEPDDPEEPTEEPADPTAAPDDPTPAPEPTPTAEAEVVIGGFDDPEEAIAAYLDDIEQYWAIHLPEVYGIEFEPVAATIAYLPSQVDTLPACGGEVAPSAVYEQNAFYCGPEDIIAWDDEVLFPDLFSQFGDFALALVLAHEYGHAIQARAGEDGPTILVELQADCFAGAWAGAVERGEMRMVGLDDGDLTEAIGGYLTFADPLGTPAEDPQAHGSGFDRLAAFAEGFEGTAEACPPILTDPPRIADIPLTPEDQETGGNLPPEELVPLIETDLVAYWGRVGPEVAGPGYEPPLGIETLGPNTVEECRPQNTDQDEVVGAVWCSVTNTVAFDQAEAVRLTADVGDFAAAYPIAHAMALSAVVASGVTDPVAAVLVADCHVGAWVGSIFDEQVTGNQVNHEISLSAGDLDEGVIGLVIAPPAGADGVDPGFIRPFDRVQRLAAGFQNGRDACA